MLDLGFCKRWGGKEKASGRMKQEIVEPIKSDMRQPKLGIGKQEEDDFFTAEENIQRKKLDIDVEGTEENIKKREKIQNEVKEICKVFFCELCNKQYKLAMEFEVHLSSYDCNHRKRFKEMKEMHGSTSRDECQKREQQRLDREMAKITDAHKQKQQQQDDPGSAPAPTVTTAATALADQEQRKALKFGFSS
ncbi:hypothetical protein CRG98_031410 [Punica granatum]|uniref:G patch domain-containing protein 8 n=1 Tax=Punica granatum TaxID=22663 RepID=A0A2I0IVX6_PUNGR|nr:hypothetical protein CRG98_031410 [Punica granatum]